MAGPGADNERFAGGEELGCVPVVGADRCSRLGLAIALGAC